MQGHSCKKRVVVPDTEKRRKAWGPRTVNFGLGTAKGFGHTSMYFARMVR